MSKIRLIDTLSTAGTATEEITEPTDFRRKFRNKQTGEVFYNDQRCAIGEALPECTYCGRVPSVTESTCVDGCGAPIK